MNIETERQLFEDEIQDFQTLNPDNNVTVLGGEDERRPNCRHTAEEEEARLSGISLRDFLCETIRIRGGTRPTSNQYKK